MSYAKMAQRTAEAPKSYTRPNEVALDVSHSRCRKSYTRPNEWIFFGTLAHATDRENKWVYGVWISYGLLVRDVIWVMRYATAFLDAPLQYMLHVFEYNAYISLSNLCSQLPTSLGGIKYCSQNDVHTNPMKQLRNRLLSPRINIKLEQLTSSKKMNLAIPGLPNKMNLLGFVLAVG